MKEQQASEISADGQTGYLELARSNVNFRRLWGGNIVSLLGDWFNFIALIAIVEDLTGSPFAVGLIFVTKMLPAAVASPIAGYIVDKFDRRRLMIWCDLARAVIVLGLLLVDDASRIYLVYLLTTLQVVIGAVFHPAQSASIPNVTSSSELLTANALMSASWSVMLALGAALGGLATDQLGPQRVFVIDSATYLLSAWFIYRTRIPTAAALQTGEGFWAQSGREVIRGWKYLRENPFSGKVATAKASWALAGGGLVYMLALAGQQISPTSPDLGVGILFAARGVGTGIGPVLARRWVVNRRKWPALLGRFVAASGIFYLIFGSLPWVVAASILIGMAHATSGANWVLSSVLLQEQVEDEFRGRVFASEMLFVMIADTVSTVTASLILQYGVVSLRECVIFFAGLQIVSGVLWWLWIRQ